VHSTTADACLRIEPTTYRGEACRLFTLNFPQGQTTARKNKDDDLETLAYAVAYHESREGCGCGDRLFARLTPVTARL
jgi:hypothetical protein